jgi:hypothetical protein
MTVHGSSSACSGQGIEQRARLLAGRLRRAGIDSLSELRDRVGVHCRRGGSSNAKKRAEQLSVKGVEAFLEGHNLWEEVRLLRNHEKRESERVAAAKAEGGDPSVALLAKPHVLVPMLQALCAASSPDDIERFSCVDTADELAMQELVKKTEDFAPALAALREVAVDRGIFKHLNDPEEFTDRDHDARGGLPPGVRVRLRGKGPPAANRYASRGCARPAPPLLQPSKRQRTSPVVAEGVPRQASRPGLYKKAQGGG